ncbi:MAG TPA: hypothetical protein VFA09_03140 [Ktedonobacteraceae bacterium]|jgi:hypothetical protein|nr:hypothetical protein [Ktedonobacteraceae bacterium]HZU66249.1 hypothetical protein [Ktedonobacteraceae bacterium]
MRQAQQTSQRGRRVRGYRIHVYRGSQHHPPSFTTPIMWREQPPVEEWKRVINDPATQSAYMIRSGRRMKDFQFTRNSSSHR